MIRSFLPVLISGGCLVAAPFAFAQVPDDPPPAAPAPAAAPASSPPPAAATPPANTAPGATPNSTFLGRDVPAFDPGTEMLQWDGKSWNINNNRFFQARFEKYLNAPEATSAEDRQYQAVLNEILTRLAPGNASRENVDYAFRLLTRGSHYDVDARLCDALADAVYTVWMAQRQQQRLAMANDSLQIELKRMQAQGAWQSKAVTAGQQANAAHSQRQSSSRNAQGGGNPPPTAPAQTAEAQEGAITASNWQGMRFAEVVARQKANTIKRELSEIQAKVEYQALILQFFMQRRFQHVLMATRFYRAIFTDGDSKLNVGDETKALFTKSSGMAPTVSTLDSLANEAVRDVREGVRAFEYLLGKDELESASKRLAEAFTVGEHLPEIRTLPREKKRKVVEFVQKSNQLLAKMETKDFAGAEVLIDQLALLARDFDSSRAKAGINTARMISGMHLQKARNAALSGDKETLQTELTAAAQLWPLNPELAEMSKKIFDQGDVMQRAILDFDQLLSQKNYRRIMEDSARFIGATALYPDRQKQLQEVMANMQTIEAAILRAEEMKRQNNYAGAWESVERIAPKFPEDSKLSQVRADLTTQASDFVRTLRSGQEMEKRNQPGAALAWFLKAQKIYPASDLAQEGVERLKKVILPES